MIDVTDVEGMKAEAERRARLRAEGKPLLDGGGVARLGRPVTPPLGAPHRASNRAVTRGSDKRPRAAGQNPPEIFPEYSSGPDVKIGAPPIAWRRGDTLWLMIPATARSKKNSTTLGIRKSPGYVRFRNHVCAIVTPFRDSLGLPLPAIDYNCAASFYMERESADTDNLISGLADALQDAGVLADDFHLRTWNGTDRFVDAARPRVEVLLTPYTGYAAS